ncbi:hypothetical protein BMS3Abin01_01392 [bacterium BMS3Abin01]|nr:hypothetical protein BMS3Abin01_01392 [bacterium BMS3Abin01]HEW79257.1 hypothetical protein [Phycisphaerales bacterium]
MTVGEKIEVLLDKALDMGADKAKIIDVGSVVVEEWVFWKCQYGCPLYNRDSLHPPCAPGSGSTRKVLGEFTKAILLNGPKGKKLSQIALNLEGEAYHAGYYKAFALIALTSAAEVASVSGEETTLGAT